MSLTKQMVLVAVDCLNGKEGKTAGADLLSRGESQHLLENEVEKIKSNVIEKKSEKEKVRKESGERNE